MKIALNPTFCFLQGLIYPTNVRICVVISRMVNPDVEVNPPLKLYPAQKR
jgi:hypothetical protein